MRELLTRLGPAFIKVGQALSSRPDLLSPAYIQELETLQDRIPPFSDAAARAVLDAELGVQAATVFASLTPSPVAAASLGQVYRGILAPQHGGGEVAVKVQRPGVGASIALDVFILRHLAAALRAGWALDARSVAVLVDPSAPNSLRFFPGEAVLADALPRRFFIELQARFGNQFERRKDGGDVEALGGALDALLTCLEPDAKCGGAVPGLAQEQRSLTTLTSAAGGFVFGFATRVGAVLPLAPLWAPLLVVYGLAPLLTRLPPVEAALPAAINVAAFVGAALLFRASPLFTQAGAARDSLTREGQARRMRTEDEEEE